jgi:hypothetical protein
MPAGNNLFEIRPGEKFACLVFSSFSLVRVDGPGVETFGDGYWVSDEFPVKLPFPLDDWWRRQLGEFVVNQLEHRSNFVLLVRRPSVGSQMDMPKSRTENFKRFSRSAAAVGILRVHGRA